MIFVFVYNITLLSLLFVITDHLLYNSLCLSTYAFLLSFFKQFRHLLMLLSLFTDERPAQGFAMKGWKIRTSLVW